jgi:hypothetical protein
VDHVVDLQLPYLVDLQMDYLLLKKHDVAQLELKYAGQNLENQTHAVLEMKYAGPNLKQNFELEKKVVIVD